VRAADRIYLTTANSKRGYSGETCTYRGRSSMRAAGGGKQTRQEKGVMQSFSLGMSENPGPAPGYRHLSPNILPKNDSTHLSYMK
jgi:hypothetical protein